MHRSFSRRGKKPEEKRKRKPDSCNLVLPERMNLTDENCSPYVSLIIPVYNVEQYLPKCLESIAAQIH